MKCVYHVTLTDGRWLLVYGESIQDVMEKLKLKSYYNVWSVKYVHVTELCDVEDALTGLDSRGRNGMQFTRKDVTVIL